MSLSLRGVLRSKSKTGLILPPRGLGGLVIRMGTKRKLSTEISVKSSKRTAAIVQTNGKGQIGAKGNIKSENTPSKAKIVRQKEQDERKSTSDEENEAVAATRPPAVNSDYLPLPWKGRLGYACLNTYLRTANPPIFCSRTCRISSILEHRHPLSDPTQPENATKNRPDKSKPADPKLGQKWVEALGLANARDIIKLMQWNERYGIKFLRLSSDMFPFASHEEYGYRLGPFASKTLEEAGKVIAELGHRVSMHPGQYCQIGSPRKVVVDNSIRELDYHDELLTLLKLPEQQDRDAVMILHMGGTFGSKEETLDRFRQNYARLSVSVRRRLVLENDDVSWCVHDLLPICQELNIPLVLDFHHNNIVFDSSKVREGTLDIMQYFPAIQETWKRKAITQKMHYSEPESSALTPRQRRKHSPRVATLPPCPPDMDLMIEAKDKEQAVFELMRKFKLPGFEKIKDVVPHERLDEQKANNIPIPDAEVGMGGTEGRVYWPLEMEDWLRPRKRQGKKSADEIENIRPQDTAEKQRTKNVKTKKPIQTAKAATVSKDQKLQTTKEITTVRRSERRSKA